MHLPFIAHWHSCMPNVCDNNVHEAQMCSLFYYLKVLISVLDGWHCGSTPKDQLADPRGSLANDIPSHAIEQANQEVQQDDCHSQHTHSNICIFKFCVLFNFVYYIIYEIKFL